MKSRFSQKEKNSIITQYWSGDTAPAVCEQYGISSSTIKLFTGVSEWFLHGLQRFFSEAFFFAPKNRKGAGFHYAMHSSKHDT